MGASLPSHAASISCIASWLGRLAPTGVAYLVVQRNLGADSLIGWLNGRGFQASKFASKKGFRIIEVRPA